VSPIPYFNVTSGEIRCIKGTPIIKKPNPSLFIKGGTSKEEKNKSLDTEQIYGHGFQRDRAGWLPAASYCSADSQRKMTEREKWETEKEER
jgi:hypothetical protein